MLFTWFACAADDAWLRPAPWPVAGGCELAALAPVPGEVAVHLLVDRAVGLERARALGPIAAGWWAEAGLRLVPAGVEVEDVGPVLGGHAAALVDEVAALPPAEAEARVLEVVLAPLRARLAGPAAPRVDVVWVETLVAPDSPVARVATDVAGLTVSPALVGRAEDDLAALLVRHLPGTYTPTVFLSDAVLRALPPEEAAGVLPHELGHALGLPHDPAVGNLMAPTFARCPPSLRPDQAALVVRP